MIAIETPIPASTNSKENFISHGKGILSWLFTIDHKRIAVLYSIAIFSSLLLGVALAIAMRLILIRPSHTPETTRLFNHLFSLHGAAMVFLFAIPAIPAILGNFVLPLQLGARSLAYPRLALLSFWLYAAGATLFFYVLLSGIIHALTGVDLLGGAGLDAGYNLSAPYSVLYASGAIFPAALGLCALALSSLLTGINFVASILTLRPAFMTWFKMPLFLWSLLAAGIIQILSAPILLGAMVMLMADRLFATGAFTPALGGDPALYQSLFSFYAQPAIFILILPAIGIAFELLSVFTRKTPYAHPAVAICFILVALLSFVAQGWLPAPGQSPIVAVFFSLFTFLMIIPLTIILLSFILSLVNANLRLTPPLLFALGSIFCLFVAVASGTLLASLPLNNRLANTGFSTGQFHFLVLSGVLGLLAGVYYWWPKITGKLYSEKIAKTAFFLLFFGIVFAFTPQFILGAQGLPRRYANYDRKNLPAQHSATAGAVLAALGLLTVVANALQSLKGNEKAPKNPWDASTLEWSADSPPIPENFDGAAFSGAGVPTGGDRPTSAGDLPPENHP